MSAASRAICTHSPTTTTPVQFAGARGARSIGSQHGFGLSRASPAEIETDLVAIVDRVTRRLRAARRVGRTVVLRLRLGDYTPTPITRAVLLGRRTAPDMLLLPE